MKDKIMNNSFNSGEVNYEAFGGEIKIEPSVLGLYEDQFGDLIEYRVKSMLDTELYTIFKDSPYHEKYKLPKRIDKSDMVKMFYYFKERIIKIGKFSNVELFIGFAEFFQINYDALYADISVMDKEYILREVSEKYGLESKIKTKKLF
jgi:hypothetical protein